MKEKTCKICKVKFTLQRPLQSVCGFSCAQVKAEKDRLKREAKEATRKRLETRKAKEAIKTRADWMKEAQQAFNSFIRARDYKEPCISCQRHHNGQYHAGHYRTTKAAPELRFNEFNVHKQCSVCNNHMSGNILEYRINLIQKIGIVEVEWLEGKHEPKKYTIDDLKQIKEAYKQKLKELRDGV